jgi:hypothetical protein
VIVYFICAIGKKPELRFKDNSGNVVGIATFYGLDDLGVGI